jgi:1-pyrroline-5-carboxylate dehydrogenase
MLKVFHVPKAVNEPKSYALNSQKEQLSMQPTQCGIKIDVHARKNEEVRTGDTKTMSAPHDHKHRGCITSKSHIEDAIATALQAKTAWANMAWEQRAGIFLKQADHTELKSMQQP